MPRSFLPATGLIDLLTAVLPPCLRAFNPFAEVSVKGVHYLLSPCLENRPVRSRIKRHGHSKLPLECISNLFHDFPECSKHFSRIFKAIGRTLESMKRAKLYLLILIVASNLP